jgi:hypothetical protein
MLRDFPDGIAELSRAARSLIFEVLPATVEVVWPHQRISGYGTGPKKMTEHFCFLQPATAHLVFGFYYGAELDDPAALLGGTGARMRNVRIRSMDDLGQHALRSLVDQATRHRVPPPAQR